MSVDTDDAALAPEPAAGLVAAFLEGCRSLFVLTGAGCSTGSGIPDYRNRQGGWKRSPPIQWQAFRGSSAARRRYWARSFVGWPRVARARPNAAHDAIAAMAGGFQALSLVTQNVDGLHQRAGSKDVIDLHGRLDRVVCLDCASVEVRDWFQARLAEANPRWCADGGAMAPDGDVDLGDADYDSFRVPGCSRCGGVMKPDVVFFGENVPRARVADSYARLEVADAMLVVGSSLMVWSGYRFVRRARELGVPVAVLNQGRTRADGEVDLKVANCCSEVLPLLPSMTAPVPVPETERG